MTGRKWSDIAQYPKWPLCGHRDVNSQWAYWRGQSVPYDLSVGVATDFYLSVGVATDFERGRCCRL